MCSMGDVVKQFDVISKMFWKVERSNRRLKKTVKRLNQKLIEVKKERDGVRLLALRLKAFIDTAEIPTEELELDDLEEGMLRFIPTDRDNMESDRDNEQSDEESEEDVWDGLYYGSSDDEDNTDEFAAGSFANMPGKRLRL